jgi:hypothetical protein
VVSSIVFYEILKIKPSITTTFDSINDELLNDEFIYHFTNSFYSIDSVSSRLNKFLTPEVIEEIRHILKDVNNIEIGFTSINPND